MTTTWDRDVDVVVLGSGGAGLTAALAAAMAGRRVDVYEAAETVGGTTAVSAGLLWIPAHKRGDTDLPVDEALTYLASPVFGRLDRELVESFVRTAPELLDFLEEHTRLRLVRLDRGDWEPELPGASSSGRSFAPAPMEHGPWAGRLTVFDSTFGGPGTNVATGAPTGGHAGATLIEGLVEAVVTAGAQLSTGARGIGLVVEDEAVVGVDIETSAGHRRIRARGGVILATGGFEWSDELTGSFLPGRIYGATSPPELRGDGLRMAMGVGAELAHMTEARYLTVVQFPGLTEGHWDRSWTGLVDLAGPGGIIVNRAGRRFVNEGGADLHSALCAQDEFTGIDNDPAFLIVDAAYFERNGAFGLSAGQAQADWASVSPELGARADGFVRRFGADDARTGDVDPDWFFESTDLATLAEKLGVDPEALVDTVAVWNGFADTGVDADFHRERAPRGRRRHGYGVASGAPSLAALNQPPFYAARLRVGVIGTRGGPRTDVDGRVRRCTGGTVPGLFAVGNAAASPLGGALPGPGGTLSPQMWQGLRAGRAVVALGS